MPKRKNYGPTEFTCPGCKEMFDAETHVPFVGSCGDSVCAVCLNEKKIKHCPECNLEVAFACKQKNTLAMKFLTAAAGKEASGSKKAKLDVGEETNASGEPVPAVSDSKNSYFSCTNCQEKFDSKIRSPFVGYCGHSLCAICVNEKDITTCPVCNTEGAFATKNKNDLAAELLDALAKGCESSVPAIIRPENRAFLPQIVNLLDPSSFVKFARTCKPMHDLCFKSNEIKIVYDIRGVQIWSNLGSMEFLANKANGFSSMRTPFNYTENDRGFLESTENRKKLQNYPFIFELYHLIICGDHFNENSFAGIRSFIGEFGIRTISQVTVLNNNNWNDLAQFVKDFNTAVEIQTDGVDVISIPDDAATCLLQNTSFFRADIYIPDEVILQASVPWLSLGNAHISKATFMELLKRFASSTKRVRWTLGRQPFEFSHYGIFTTESVDSFDCKPLSDERPLVLVKENNNREFHILREDGKRLKCVRYLCVNEINFSSFDDD